MSDREVIPIREQAEAQQDRDPINPAYYKSGEVECVDALRACMSREEFIGGLRWNAIKYLWRMNSKGDPLENARKCQWYVSQIVYWLGRWAAEDGRK